jgi:iron-sulfur cluster repair protein YtfE (RIC family)
VKRHESLRPLSRDHHHGLAEARALRWAVSGRAGTPREARKHLLSAWERWLSSHFEDEERWLVPLIPDPADARRLEAEHRDVRGLIEALDRAGEESEPHRDLLERIATRLHDHIRWEERQLFPSVEATASESALATLAEHLARPPSNRFGHDSLSTMDPH